MQKGINILEGKQEPQYMFEDYMMRSACTNRLHPTMASLCPIRSVLVFFFIDLFWCFFSIDLFWC